jgi:hypothetical protein
MTAPKINSPNQLPAMCDTFARERFYGEVRLVFQSGRLCRMVVEQSIQVGENSSEPAKYIR